MSNTTKALVRQETKAARARQVLEYTRLIASNPLLLGAAGLAINEVVYRVGLFDPRPGEAEESDLGGPVWFGIGPAIPRAQARRNLIRNWVMSIAVAMAIGQSGKSLSQAIELVK